MGVILRRGENQLAEIDVSRIEIQRARDRFRGGGGVLRLPIVGQPFDVWKRRRVDRLSKPPKPLEKDVAHRFGVVIRKTVEAKRIAFQFDRSERQFRSLPRPAERRAGRRKRRNKQENRRNLPDLPHVNRFDRKFCQRTVIQNRDPWFRFCLGNCNSRNQSRDRQGVVDSKNRFLTGAALKTQVYYFILFHNTRSVRKRQEAGNEIASKRSGHGSRFSLFFPGFRFGEFMRPRFFLVIILCLALSTLLSGCVRRRMTVRSNPPGATVYLDGKEIGRTPFSANFLHYGKREFRLVKDGYETKTVIMPVRAPWYEWFPIDFVSEVLLPGKLTDRKYYEFDMQPVAIVPTPELLGRAEELRRHAHVNGALRVTDSPIIDDPARQSGSLAAPAPVFAPPVAEGATVYPQPLTPPLSNPTSAPTTPQLPPSFYMPPKL